MKFTVCVLLLVNLVTSYDDDILSELTADLKRILEAELALPVTSEQSDEDLQHIEGSGDDFAVVSSVTSEELPVPITSTIATTTTTTTTTMTTTRRSTSHKPRPITIKPGRIVPHLLKICMAETECFSDTDCGKGRCFGTHMGKCNCRACVPSRNCTEDSDCGGLRGACHEGACHCERALSTHGFKLMVDAVLGFCDQKKCKAHGNDCHGLPCHVGKCRCPH